MLAISIVKMATTVVGHGEIPVRQPPGIPPWCRVNDHLSQTHECTYHSQQYWCGKASASPTNWYWCKNLRIHSCAASPHRTNRKTNCMQSYLKFYRRILNQSHCSCTAERFHFYRCNKADGESTYCWICCWVAMTSEALNLETNSMTHWGIVWCVVSKVRVHRSACYLKQSWPCRTTRKLYKDWNPPKQVPSLWKAPTQLSVSCCTCCDWKKKA